MRDATAICKNCEDCACFNPKPPKDSVVIPEYTVEDLMPMDEIRMDLMKHQEKVFHCHSGQGYGLFMAKTTGQINIIKRSGSDNQKDLPKGGHPLQGENGWGTRVQRPFPGNAEGI